MKEEPLPNFDPNRTLEEIQEIRSQRDANRERILGFDNANKIPDEPQAVKALITVIHPDGISNMEVTNNDELAAAIIAVYSDGHGDFGWYDNDISTEDSDLER